MNKEIRFGRLILVKYVGKNKNRQDVWLCRCNCGTEKEITLNNLRTGNTASCGCISRERPNATIHGMEGTRVHNIWMGIIRRCNPGSSSSWNYYNRGIRVCERWKRFENFFEDIGHPPDDSYSIERVDNDGDYTPGNCRWATSKEQANNRLSNRWIEFNGERLTLQQWADKLKLTHGTILYRLSVGYPLEIVLSPQRLKTGMKAGTKLGTIKR